MLSRLRNMLAGTAYPSYPSAALILEAASTTTYVLHMVPEDGAIERVQYTRPGATHFRYGGPIEQSREQLGTVLLHIGDGETPDKFFAAVSVQATRLLREKAATQESGNFTVDEALRSAALSNLHEREGREPPVNAAQSYPVALVRIDRSQPGKIMSQRVILTGDSDPSTGLSTLGTLVSMKKASLSVKQHALWSGRSPVAGEATTLIARGSDKRLRFSLPWR